MPRYLLTILFGFISLLPASFAHPVEAPPLAITQQKETTVYTTRTGEKYHRSGCRYLSKSKIKTTKEKAIKGGYGACKVCKP